MSPRSLFVALPALAAAAGAQSVPLVLEGDVIPGAGAVVDVLDVAVNDHGDWLALVATDAGNQAVLKNGAVLLKTGDPLATPGLAVHSFHRLHLNDAGEAGGLVYTFSGISAAFGDVPFASTGDPVTAPGFTPGTFYTTLHQADLNAQRQFALSVNVDDPAIAGLVDRAIVRLQVDASGALVSSSTVVKEGDVLAGTTSPVVSLPQYYEPNLVLNDAGDVLYLANLNFGQAVARNQTALAVRGGQSPIFGKTWTTFNHAAADLNDQGDHVFGGAIDAPASENVLLAWNGIKFVQEGDELASIAPYSLREAGSLSLAASPVFLTDDSRIFWYGEWTSPDAARDGGIFLDYELVVQEGVTLGGGVPLDEVGTEELPFEASDNGRFLILTGVREDGLKGAFLLELEPKAAPYSGCAANAGVLSSILTPKLGENFTFTLDQGQASNVAAYVAVSNALPAGFPPCGIPLGGAGELLIDVAPPNPLALIGPAAWPGFGIPGLAAWITVPVPDHPSMLGLHLYAQGLFVDVAGVAPGEPLRLSNGLELVIGLP